MMTMEVILTRRIRNRGQRHDINHEGQEGEIEEITVLHPPRLRLPTTGHSSGNPRPVRLLDQVL